MSRQQKIILASSSPYRRDLLQRFKFEFEVLSPSVDETAGPQESAQALVLRLALAKAEAVAKNRQNALIIAADQVASLDGRFLGKPGDREQAISQLQSMRGRTVNFINGLCVINTTRQRRQSDIVIYNVSFREYSDDEIERYLDLDHPYDCAGSFKSEQLGISLIDRMQGDDPSALVGLPLIRLATMLREEGLKVP
jgi:septum formation protein